MNPKVLLMCGRFSFVASKEKIQKQLGDIDTGSNLRTSFNVAPTQHSYVITNDQPKKLQYLTWGLIPYWTKGSNSSGKLINARSEGIESKPSFRVPIRKRRCLVLADSFYEWKRSGKSKIPFRMLPKNGDLLIMAGIWDIWYQDEYPVKSFSIITVPPNKEVSPIHDRMPVLLTTRKEQNKWLDEISLEEALSLLKTPKDNYLKLYRVSEKVNSVRNNSPELHEEIPDQLELF